MSQTAAWRGKYFGMSAAWTVPEKLPATLVAVDARQSPEQRNANRGRRTDPAGKKAARRALQIPDLGSRQGTCRPQAVQHGNTYRRLLLRPAQPLAARLKRKHQSPAAPVLPQGP